MMMTIMNGGLGGRGKNGREITNARTIDRREEEGIGMKKAAADCKFSVSIFFGRMAGVTV